MGNYRFLVRFYPRVKALDLLHQRFREIVLNLWLMIFASIGWLAACPDAGGSSPPGDLDLNFTDEGEPLTPTSNAPQQRGTLFMELEAEIEIEQWSSLGTSKYDVRCIMGTNEWLIDGLLFAREPVVYWFTGTNIVEQGQHLARSTLSLDGNPSRPPRHRDAMSFPARIAWLAFCSGPALKREDKMLFPLDDFWKQTMWIATFRNNTRLFENKFGLPKHLDLLTPGGQPVLQYRVVNSTNLLGWEFPLAFQFIQYRPMRLLETRTLSTNYWELDFLARGKVSSIGPAKLVPSEFMANWRN